mgnify:CR=1 FL=1
MLTALQVTETGHKLGAWLQEHGLEVISQAARTKKARLAAAAMGHSQGIIAGAVAAAAAAAGAMLDADHGVSLERHHHSMHSMSLPMMLDSIPQQQQQQQQQQQYFYQQQKQYYHHQQQQQQQQQQEEPLCWPAAVEVPPSNNLAGQSLLPLPPYQSQARLLKAAQQVMHAQHQAACQAPPPSSAAAAAAAAATATAPVPFTAVLRQEQESEAGQGPLCSTPAAGPVPLPTGDLLVGSRVETWSQLDGAWFGARVEVRTAE